MIHVIFFIMGVSNREIYWLFTAKSEISQGSGCAVTLDDISDFAVNNYYIPYLELELRFWLSNNLNFDRDLILVKAFL